MLLYFYLGLTYKIWTKKWVEEETYTCGDVFEGRCLVLFFFSVSDDFFKKKNPFMIHDDHVPFLFPHHP